MKYTLPVLTVAGLVVLPAAIVLAQFPQTPIEAAPAVSLPPLVAQSASAPGSPPSEGQQLVRDALESLLRQPGVEARIRQRVEILNQRLVGAGTYLQLQGPGQPLLCRLELKLQLGNSASSVQQVCDGRFLWTRRDLSGSQVLSRVDLRQIDEALAQSATVQGSGGPAPQWNAARLARGGLPALLQSLEDHFDFGPPRADSIRFPVASGDSDAGPQLEVQPVWIVEGRWKPKRVLQWLPEQREAIERGESPRLESLPGHLPHRVELVLGRETFIPLFPYRIEYQTLVKDSEGDLTGTSTPMLTMELFEVNARADLQPHFFEYHPGDQAVVDETAQFLQRLRAG